MEQVTRGEIQDRLEQFAARGLTERAALLEDPRGAVESQLGVRLPDDLRIEVLVDPPNATLVVLPHQVEDGELCDADLERVAGGLGDKRTPGDPQSLMIIFV